MYVLLGVLAGFCGLRSVLAASSRSVDLPGLTPGVALLLEK